MATSGSSGVADQVGRVLGDRYRLVAPIGSGASAQVHVADDTRLGRRVAVKVLHPALAADETFLRRFRAEARAAAALSHPNIMAVYDWGDQETPYLVLELLSGGSLRSMLDAGHRLSLSQALIVGLEAGRALEAAHRSGFVHRDIKPANLLFGEDGRLRIADFGLARALSEAAWTEPGDGLVGTARYAAPEQASGGRVDGKADVYALALVLIEAVTGAVPRVADSVLATIRLRADEAVPVPDELRELKPILERALEPDPAARPDAAELVQTLLEVARQLDRPQPLPLVGLATAANEDDTALPTRAHADLTTHAEPGTPAATPPKRRRWWRVVVAILVVLAIGAGAFLLWSSVQAASATVPDLAGRTEQEARDAIAEVLAGEDDEVEWAIEVTDEFSDGVEEGVVIRTDPPGTSSLDDGSTLTLVLSAGPEPVAVPALVDVDEAAARRAIEDADLTVGDVTREFSETIPAGQVTGWSVDGVEKPTESPKGSEVDIRISDGPEPRTIPELAGAPPDDAERELAELGLVVERREEFSDDVDKGDVIGTDPPAGAKVARGDTVVLLISKGQDLVEVPDVSGMNYSDAYDALQAAGFVIGDDIGQGNRVVGTDPDGGTMARRGSTVRIERRR